MGEAVASPQRVGHDLARARQLLELVPQVPALTWGRDELHVGDMWNSNSLIAWLLARSDHEVGSIDPPAHGRAPGWRAGLVVAAHQAADPDSSDIAPCKERVRTMLQPETLP